MPVSRSQLYLGFLIGFILFGLINFWRIDARAAFLMPELTATPTATPLLSTPTRTHWAFLTLGPSATQKETGVDQLICATVTEIPQTECEALVAIYNKTGGSAWTNKINWGQTDTPCTWLGVTCTEGHVTELDLDNENNGNNLTGVLPDEIGDLPHLTHIDLSHNQLIGVAAGIGNLKELYRLSLGLNQVETLPPEIGQLQNLWALDVQSNQLQDLPDEIGGLSSLTILQLSKNQLRRLPNTIGRLVSLEDLNLSENQLSDLPQEIGDLSSLIRLWLPDNQFTTLSLGITDLSNLTSLFLSANQLSTVPPEIANLSTLTWLDLAANELTNIPSDIGLLSNLEGLWIPNNQLEYLPVEIGNLVNLSTLQAESNKLASLPTELQNLSALNSLYLAYNRISIPDPALFDFVTQLDSEWNQTQTVPPSNLSITSLSHDSIQLSWDPIPFQGRGGYYEISLSSEQPSNFQPVATTTDKTNSAYIVNGLAPCTTYFARIRTYTPLHSGVKLDDNVDDQRNNLWSTMGASSFAKTMNLPPTPIHTPTKTSTATSTSTPTSTPMLTATPSPGVRPTLTATTTPRPTVIRPMARTLHQSPSNPCPGDVSTPIPTETPTEIPTDTPTDIPTSTPPTPIPTPDGGTFEMNDSCSSAKSILAAQTQTHTFHDAGDVDWIKFNAQEGTLYRVEVLIPDGSDADVNVELYKQCDDTNFARWNQTFSPGARIDFTASTNGSIYLRLANQDAGVFGDDTTYEVLVRQQAEENPNKAAIIVAGRLRGTDRLQDNIHNVTDAVYKMFQEQGYSPDQIYYLATDSSLVGYDAAATTASLQAAITRWATERVTPDGVLNLYMVDHGGPSTFYIDGVGGQEVSPVQLHEWLSEFEQAVCRPTNCTTLPKVNVFIEACQSGSFIQRPNSISQSNRVVVTSSSALNDAFASRSGAYFSDHLITGLSQGKNLLTSFVEAKAVANRVYSLQDAWLDADGNGVANELADSSMAATRGFLFANTLGDNWEPHIFDVQPPAIVINSSGVITVDVRDNQKIDLVWAVVYPPDYEPPATQQVLQAETLDNFLFSSTGVDDLYTGRFSGFTQTGRYRIVIHAEDNDGLRARPVEVDVMIDASVYHTYLPMVAR